MGFPRNFLLLLCTLIVSGLSTAESPKYEGSEFWWDLARTELEDAINVKDNWGVAKNVILFLGDGMGIAAQTAARIYKGQKKGMYGEEGYLQWERFPNSAIIKTYNEDRQVPDSAATATAFLCGVKANFQTLGLDPRVTLGDCEGSKRSKNQLTSILQWAQEAGLATGLVTTTRVTHATPAAAYANAANRNWECNRKPSESGFGCPDIAEQLVHHNPGENINVILGGGRQTLGANLDTPHKYACSRTDKRDLSKEWLDQKLKDGHRAKYITTAQELKALNTSNLEYLMGLFADSNMPFTADLDPSNDIYPTIAEMTRTAIDILSKNKTGFFLLVEGGRIDHGYHNNQPLKALEETLAFEDALSAALKKISLQDSLVVVTADHSHVLTINGYPKRGNDILGFADNSQIDGLPFTTLMFTNGPGFNMTTNGTHVTRADPRDSPLTDKENFAQTAVPTYLSSETHGGEDVALYAAGPMSHLFHRNHEQHYIPHVMAYAACIGPSDGQSCKRPSFVEKMKKMESFSLPYSPLPLRKTSLDSKNTKRIGLDTFVDLVAEVIRAFSPNVSVVQSSSEHSEASVTDEPKTEETTSTITKTKTVDTASTSSSVLE